MGAWGTSLYANDTTSDIRADYIDKLRRGKTNKEATEELIDQNRDIIGDIEEESLFWYALADTQWNYGRLMPETKAKALSFLSKEAELERWKQAGEKKLSAWENTLKKLREKLESPPPEPKKVSKYRIYRCKWRLGDVYAYRFSSKYSKEKGFDGQYTVFRKVSEDTWWPGHIVPVVQIYKWIGSDLPSIDDLSEFDLLPAFYKPAVFEKFPNKILSYKIKLISESERVIPKENLIFLGNLPGDELIPFVTDVHSEDYYAVGWESSRYNKFEDYIIDMYLAWKDK